jgi:hypothetical protein
MPAFAEVDDLAARLQGGIEDDDTPRAQAALDDASTLIRAETGMDWESDVPEIVVTVTLWAALRTFSNPEGLSQESLASYSYSKSNPSTDVYLTAKERRLVRREAGVSGLWAQPTSRGDTLDTPCTDPQVVCAPNSGTQYIPVEPDGEPMPWAGPDGY